MEKVSKLFITHNTATVGGANHSLKNLINGLNEKVDLMAPKDAWVSSRVLKKYFGPNIQNVYRFDLPFRTSYLSAVDHYLDWCEREIRYRKNKKAIMDLIAEKGYDFIHLNSYVLYPLLTRKYPIYIHIRELCNANLLLKKAVQGKMRKSRGIIYIDFPTKEALGVAKNSMVLNNPFDQTNVPNVDLQKVRKRYSINESETVFAFIAASNNAEKGMEFVAEAFLKSSCENAKLLIVGPQKVSAFTGKSNIIFTGKVLEMDEIYAISDYVLRGDSQFCIGRTVYEGLYSGCNVLIPGCAKTDAQKVFEYERFRNQIFFYKPRNQRSLADLILNRADKRKEAVLGLSNTAEYVKRIQTFLLQ